MKTKIIIAEKRINVFDFQRLLSLYKGAHKEKADKIVFDMEFSYVEKMISLKQLADFIPREFRAETLVILNIELRRLGR